MLVWTLRSFKTSSDLWILKTSHWDQAAKDMGLGQEAAVEGQGPWVLVLDHQQLLLRPLLPQLKLIDLLATGIPPWLEKESSQHLPEQALGMLVVKNLAAQYLGVEGEDLSCKENERRPLKLREHYHSQSVIPKIVMEVGSLPGRQQRQLLRPPKLQLLGHHLLLQHKN